LQCIINDIKEVKVCNGDICEYLETAIAKGPLYGEMGHQRERKKKDKKDKSDLRKVSAQVDKRPQSIDQANFKARLTRRRYCPLSTREKTMLGKKAEGRRKQKNDRKWPTSS